MELIPLTGRVSNIESLNSSGRVKTPSESYLNSLHSSKSREVMRSYLNRVAQLFGYRSHQDADWSKLVRDDVSAVMDYLAKEGRSPNTVRVYLAAIKGVVKEAWSKGLVSAEQLERVRSVKPPKGVRLPKGRRLQDSEVAALLKACEKGGGVRGARDAALLSILVGCGLRRSEVVAIKLSDMDLGAGEIRVLGKGDKERLAHLPGLVVEKINGWLEYRGEHEGYLFNRVWKNDGVSDYGLTDRAVLFILERRAQEAKIKPCRPHDLRRTFATKLFEQKVDALTIQKMMGHANLETTQKYDKRGDDEAKRVANSFEFGV